MVKDEVLHVIHNSTLPTSREQTPSQASKVKSENSSQKKQHIEPW